MNSPEPGMHAAEEDSYFVSMTDLMVGMLFIFIIMLMAFALNLREQEEKFDVTTSALTKANETRREMLEDIKKALERQGVTVFIDVENGVLRLPEELLFPRGEYRLTENGQDKLKRLAAVLSHILPCYSNAPGSSQVSCPPSPGGQLEAVFIEGHTDDRPIIGKMNNGIRSNWELSTERAIETFKAITQETTVLASIENDKKQKLLGVSGYAEYRPVKVEDTDEARSSNRRIDLRFLMETPNTEDIEKIRRSIGTGAEKQ